MAKIQIKITVEGEVKLDAHNQGKGFTGNTCNTSTKLSQILKWIEKAGEIDEIQNISSETNQNTLLNLLNDI
jgi:hypothetical protein